MPKNYSHWLLSSVSKLPPLLHTAIIVIIIITVIILLYEYCMLFHTSRNRHWPAPHLQQRILPLQVPAILRPLPGVLHIRN